jgi:drug/metabolite transporter (DMT)-like permease
MKMMKSYFGEFILLLASIIWGTAFIFQSIANGVMQPYTFVTTRSLIATIVMGIFILIRAKFNPNKQLFKLGKPQGYRLAIFAGLALSIAMILQQVGLLGTTSGKAGFLTALYILFVPLLGFFIKKKPTISVWLGLLGAIIGFYFLSFNGETGFSINVYDVLILGCAFAYAFQIFFIDQIQNQMDSLMFSFVQFAVATVITSVPMFIVEGIDFSFLQSPTAIYALLYVGVVSSCIAYTFQIIGQKRVKSAPVATLIMSLEAVFAVLAGLLFLQESITLTQTFGMSLILSSIILVNLPWKKIQASFQK